MYSKLHSIYKNYLIRHLFKRRVKKDSTIKHNKPHDTSYSQAGEDIVINNILFNILKLQSMTYLDIGCHEPISLSNTYYFYKRNFRGVCVDPDPTLKDKYRDIRPDDKFVNLAISDSGENKDLDYYIMTGHPALNTIDKVEADKLVRQKGISIEKTIKVKTGSINFICEKYFKESPDLLSVDVEGHDFAIIQSLNYEKYKPKVIVVEVQGYADRGRFIRRKIKQYKQFFDKRDYYLYTKVGCNCIFVERNTLMSRLLK